jgi:hypothetical protein
MDVQLAFGKPRDQGIDVGHFVFSGANGALPVESPDGADGDRGSG